MDFGKEEYEIQFFGFSAEQFKIEHRLQIGTEIRNFSRGLIESGVNELSNYISKENAIEILKNVDLVSDKLYESCENELKQLDELADKYFKIPDNALLYEDEIHLKSYTEIDEKYFEDKIKEFEEMIKQNNYLIARLQSDFEKFDTLKESIKAENDLATMLEENLKIDIDLNRVEKKLAHLENASKDLF